MCRPTQKYIIVLHSMVLQLQGKLTFNLSINLSHSTSHKSSSKHASLPKPFSNLFKNWQIRNLIVWFSSPVFWKKKCRIEGCAKVVIWQDVHVTNLTQEFEYIGNKLWQLILIFFITGITTFGSHFFGDKGSYEVGCKVEGAFRGRCFHTTH